MFKKIFSLFLILAILSSLVFVFYWFFFKKTTNSSKSSSSSKPEKITKDKNINLQTTGDNNQNISHYSLLLLQNNLSKVDHNNWRETTKINYFIPAGDFKNLNNYQISSIVFNPLFWEKLIIGQILTYFHAVNLIVTFQYWNSFTACLVKIAYQKFWKTPQVETATETSFKEKITKKNNFNLKSWYCYKSSFIK